jgi:hypothetical protein
MEKLDGGNNNRITVKSMIKIMIRIIILLIQRLNLIQELRKLLQIQLILCKKILLLKMTPNETVFFQEI